MLSNCGLQGFSLRELLSCLDDGFHWRVSHPPPSNKTLFDAQLKIGGFSASDFRAAGRRASELSESYFWEYDADTPGEAQWESTCAFFNASELRSAGYSFLELRRADQTGITYL